MKKKIQIVCLLSTLVLSSVKCKKNDINNLEPISNILESPCGNGERIYKDFGIKYSLLRTIQNVETTIEKNKFDNKTYFFRITIDNSEYWLNPCNFPDEFKINNLKVILSLKVYKVICPKDIGCNDGDYPSPSEIILIQKK